MDGSFCLKGEEWAVFYLIAGELLGHDVRRRANLYFAKREANKFNEEFLTFDVCCIHFLHIQLSVKVFSLDNEVNKVQIGVVICADFDYRCVLMSVFAYAKSTENIYRFKLHIKKCFHSDPSDDDHSRPLFKTHQ